MIARASIAAKSISILIYSVMHVKITQAAERKCFVAVPKSANRILGFYTLSPASVGFARVPSMAKKGLGRYDVPVFRLGRLAVDRSVQGKGLGGALLLRAGERCLRVSADVGGVALLVDAKNEAAARWYQRFGAAALLDAPLSLVLPLAVIEDALKPNS